MSRSSSSGDGFKIIVRLGILITLTVFGVTQCGGDEDQIGWDPRSLLTDEGTHDNGGPLKD